MNPKFMKKFKKERKTLRKLRAIQNDEEDPNKLMKAKKKQQNRLFKSEIRIGMLLSLAKHIIRCTSTNRVRWDLFVIILAIWNCIYIPFNISFEPAV
jgi:hypothetical protein